MMHGVGSILGAMRQIEEAQNCVLHLDLNTDLSGRIWSTAWPESVALIFDSPDDAWLQLQPLLRVNEPLFAPRLDPPEPITWVKMQEYIVDLHQQGDTDSVTMFLHQQGIIPYGTLYDWHRATTTYARQVAELEHQHRYDQRRITSLGEERQRLLDVMQRAVDRLDNLIPKDEGRQYLALLDPSAQLTLIVDCVLFYNDPEKHRDLARRILFGPMSPFTDAMIQLQEAVQESAQGLSNVFGGFSIAPPSNVQAGDMVAVTIQNTGASMPRGPPIRLGGNTAYPTHTGNQWTSTGSWWEFTEEGFIHHSDNLDS